MSREAARDVICCSLEPWDDIWRRNQFLADGVVELRPTLRLLFVELPVDVTWSLAHGRRPPSGALRAVGATGRLWAATPRKWLPRRVRPGGDGALGRQVQALAHRLDFERPVLWINDSTYADLAVRTGWPSVYDVTDDWLLVAHTTPRELDRQRRNDTLMLRQAGEVVVCSPSLASSRGADRPVHLIPNGVDVAHFRRPQPRPADLPAGRVVLYQGSLNAGRLDIELCVRLARRLAGLATFVLVGPNSLSEAMTADLLEAGAVVLGGRPYARIPAYLQHADVLVVPHLVSPFTESLDPIKARELVAVGRPTLSTAVAGFRNLGPPVTIVSAAAFADRLVTLLGGEPPPPGPGPLEVSPPTWRERAVEFLAVLDAAAGR